MGIFSLWQWIVVLIIILVLFGGRGKISSLLGDFGKGLRAFRQEMKEDEKKDSKKPKKSAPPQKNGGDKKDR